MKDETPLDPGRYAHLRANAAAQRLATVNRLTHAIAQLESEKRPITTFTRPEMREAVIARNVADELGSTELGGGVLSTRLLLAFAGECC